ncbi:MAG TPA: zinc ABC transporter substrate-binding protein [Jatrophihabitans sp.]|nr:zinc ABC transporter substrate-binding protein [Jatrophihabitans sp.]
MARHIRALAGALLAAALLAGCATSPARSTGSGGPILVVASVNVWGSILAQLGGSRVHETSIITSPATDPHDYEPSPVDARTIIASRLFVENGIGYDPWAAQAVRANPDRARTVIDVGQVTGVRPGGNPHRWYSPSDVAKVADAITAALGRLDPAGAGYYADRRRAFETTGLADYHRLIADIKARYAGIPVGASESIFAPLADALGLDLITPPGFLKAISEGTDPSTADKVTIDTQIRERKVKIYVFNSQNSTPDVAGQVAAARASGIPVVAVTETLTPATATFQEWQTSQLQALQAALRAATSR